MPDTTASSRSLGWLSGRTILDSSSDVLLLDEKATALQGEEVLCRGF